MIIFYNKKNRDIIGTIEGRVHPKEVLENSWVRVGGLEDEDVGKYVVPFKTKYEMIEQPKTEMRVVDKKTMRVEEVRVGIEVVKRAMGMVPDVSFADLITDFESGEKRIYDYKVKLKNNKVIGFEKK